MSHEYELLDSGRGQKLERFGEVTLARPCSQAVWKRQLSDEEWLKADALFVREPEPLWKSRKRLPREWKAEVSKVEFKLSVTDFGHLGVFPEHAQAWSWIQEEIRKSPKEMEMLNLFAYSGGATLAAAQAGAAVCHLDASKPMVAWARENAKLNGLEQAPIRWITDDAGKFLTREMKRGRTYEGIILDPPSFGRGTQGQTFKIEDDLPNLLIRCRRLIEKNPRFIWLSCHTPGLTPTVLQHLLGQAMEGLGGECGSGEMLLKGRDKVLNVPCGTYAWWRCG